MIFTIINILKYIIIIIIIIIIILNILHNFFVKMKFLVYFFILILEVMKTGSGNLTFCVTFQNFSCLILACLLCCSRLMSLILVAFWLGICVELDVDMITTHLHPIPPHPYVFVPTHSSLFNTGDSYLKSVRA